MGAVELVRRICVDLALWFCAPVVFISIYVWRYPVSTGAVLPHLRIALVAWVALAVIRFVLARLAPRESIARAVSVGILSVTLTLVTAYYVAVFVGLDSWGQVISWDLIRSYAMQAMDLADALQISPILAVLAAAGLYVIVLAPTWLVLRRFDWTWSANQNTPLRLFVLIALAGPAVVIAASYSFAISRAGDYYEPVSLTLFPTQASNPFQDHTIDRLFARRQDAIEDAARNRYSPAERFDPVNVILIVVDALRADHLAVYGYPRDTTPTLERLRETGRLRIVAGVRSSCAESSCGLMSIAASKYVHQFSTRPFTLHEALRRHGYRIHLILGGDHTNFYGLKEAYGDVDSYFDGAHAGGRYVNDDSFVVERAAQLPEWRGSPTMLHFHLMSAHLLGKRHPESIVFTPAVNYALPKYRVGADESAFVNHYDNGVRQADQVIGQLLSILQTKGYLEKALVVITADHGESVGEHGHYAHTGTVTEPALNIPLLLAAYGYDPQPLVPRLSVAQVDIAPTILTEIGLPRPGTWVGVPLQEPAPPSFSYFQQKQEVGLIDARDPQRLWKYWIDRDSGRQYAFELLRDPHESTNVIQSVPQELKREWIASMLQFRFVSNHVHLK